MVINPMSSVDHLRTSILNYITMAYLMVLHPNELTGQPPEFNIELHFNAQSNGVTPQWAHWTTSGVQYWTKPNELTQLPPEFDIELH